MVIKTFFLVGQGPSSEHEIHVDDSHNIEAIKEEVAGYYNIILPEGIDFQSCDGKPLDFEEVIASGKPIGVTVDGCSIRPPSGPKGLPVVGSFYEVFPDHLGNHARLFQEHGSVIKYDTMGKPNYLTNDPVIGGICFAESAFFTKEINDNHPLAAMRNESALFLCDTSSPAFAPAHKFLVPALTPKAIRHYTPLMQQTVEETYGVFDKLDEEGEAWNAYQYMLKLASQTIGKFALGMDFGHFNTLDSPLHPLVTGIAENLALNKRISQKGAWLAKLPFGDPKKLREGVARVIEMVNEACENAPKGDGGKDLPLATAAMGATCVVDYLMRATDEKGNKIDHDLLLPNMISVVGAGFVTTSALLSWLLYSLCKYDQQDRLLQELIDHGVTDKTEWTPDLADSLTFQDKFIKETQRRHNPSFQPGRTAKVDCILPGGYLIPAGAVIIVAIHALHNNPKLWNNPDNFDPDRWDTDAVKNRPKNSYIPFATGPRSCIGFNFALGETRVILPCLIYRYEFSIVGDHTVEYDPEFQLVRPMNLYLRAKKRTEWPSRSFKMNGDDA